MNAMKCRKCDLVKISLGERRGILRLHGFLVIVALKLTSNGLELLLKYVHVKLLSSKGIYLWVQIQFKVRFCYLRKMQCHQLPAVFYKYSVEITEFFCPSDFLREIIRVSKYAISTISEALNFEFNELLHFLKAAI